MNEPSLVFVGLGIGSKGITAEGIEAVKDSDVAYLEYYTSPYEPRLLTELTRITGKELRIVDRAFVEDGRRIIEEAKKMYVTVLVQGDPMIATTHNDLRVRAIKSGIKTKVIHSASIPCAAASSSGLHYYKFGATVTATQEALNYPTQIYELIHRNLLYGRHTLVLIEYDVETGSGISVNDFMKSLLQAENNLKRKVIDQETFLIVLSRLGMSNEEIAAGKISKLINREFGEHPHCIIIPGSLHFTEVEAIEAIFSLRKEEIADNSSRIRRTAEVLIKRYAQKARRAIQSIKQREKFKEIIENAELYLRDSEEFLAKGEDELAMLSIGYAEGLIDSLNYLNLERVEW